MVDETGTNLAKTPHYGRAPRGERVVGKAPRNHGPNTTLIAALRLEGITAAMTLEGAMNRDAFDLFVAEVLAPSLRPGQIVIGDNLNVHKSPDAAQPIAARGCHQLWLPPYSPDMTPIEQAFSTLKAALPLSSAALGLMGALLVGLVAGLIPAFSAARASVVQALKG